MEIKILKQEPKKLLSREECSALIKEKLTPSNAALKEELSKKMGKSAELIVIKRITQKFGQNESEVKFFVYVPCTSYLRTKAYPGHTPAPAPSW